MSIGTRKDLRALRRAGRAVAATLQALREAVRPGLTTLDLDAVAAEALARFNARSAPQLVYGFPGSALISINDEAVHGVPGPRVVQSGDVVKFDVTAELDGYIADAAETVLVEPATEEMLRLSRGTKLALEAGLEAARAGNRISDIGRAVQDEAKRHKLTVLRQLSGHGVGRTIHEAPEVPNYPVAGVSQLLPEGLVIAIEPVLSMGSHRVVDSPDGWTLRTADGSLAAHFEHSIVITRGKPIILTAA